MHPATNLPYLQMSWSQLRALPRYDQTVPTRPQVGFMWAARQRSGLFLVAVCASRVETPDGGCQFTVRWHRPKVRVRADAWVQAAAEAQLVTMSARSLRDLVANSPSEDPVERRVREIAERRIKLR